MHLWWRWLTRVTAARRASGSLNLFFTLKRGGRRAARRCRHAGLGLTKTHLWQREDDLIDIPPLTAHHKFTEHKKATWIRVFVSVFHEVSLFYTHVHILCIHVYRGSLHLGLNLIKPWRTPSLFLVWWLDFSIIISFANQGITMSPFIQRRPL